MSDLAEFLLARIAEDERAAAPFRNDLGESRPWGCDEVGGTVRRRPVLCGDDGVIAQATTHMAAEHIARHDPARVLAECEMKRRFIELADEATGLDLQVDGEFGVGARDDVADPLLGDVMLRALALPYADHPDYDEAWRPAVSEERSA